ncbi:MAG: hypothetical protein Fur0041_16040 [Bacteroidia bacterium]
MKPKGNKFQPIAFRNVNEMLEYIPDKERKIAELLRKIILSTLDGCTEKLSYNVPFYFLNKRVCYIWPAAIPWGNVKSGIALGFCRGSELRDNEYFDLSDRKRVKVKTFHSISEINTDLIRSFLYEAAELDQQKKTT